MNQKQKLEELPGFSAPAENNEENEDSLNNIVKKPSKKTGGFNSMALNYNIIKGITKRGYKQPTPIQRKVLDYYIGQSYTSHLVTIPLILEGRDVVAMARTGSGKTACFLIPMLERLKARNAKTGARALILSPTRELALQTLKFIKELGRFVGLKSAIILGGDSMDDQFSAIHGNPDVIVATPGRFLHVCMEMELKLNGVEYVVFDEADRLFEMGLSEQLTEILGKLPSFRQTVLFSATLPKVLVEFAKAGLSDPVLLRLDVESKIPEELQLHYFLIRPEEKMSALLVLLKTLIKSEEQTIVFAATKHHVEYIHMILDYAGISNTYIYSNLDPSARKINAAKFSTGKVKVLVVTDVAARGIDIPQLDNVINYNFPAKSKLFVHRVGRCARAGRSGTAYSLTSPEEYPFLLDLHLFLGRPVLLSKDSNIGRIPQSFVEEQQSYLINLHEKYIDLVGACKTSENGYQQYLRSRPQASSDSNRRVKEINFNSSSVHPLFASNIDSNEVERENFLSQLKNYRPQGTIFEICGKNNSKEYQVMKEKRELHKDKIRNFHELLELKKKSENNEAIGDNTSEKLPELAGCSNDEINEAFKEVVLPKKRKLEDLYKKNSKRTKTRDENYISYLPSDRHTEAGFAVNNFQNEAKNAQLDIVGDSEVNMKRTVQQKKWDRKKKKMVNVEDKRVGKIRTESGAWIPATYKSNRYNEWKERTKADANANNSDDGEDGDTKHQSRAKLNTRWARHNEKLKLKQHKSELKNTDQILKARKIQEKKNAKQRGKGKKGGNRGKASSSRPRRRR